MKYINSRITKDGLFELFNAGNNSYFPIWIVGETPNISICVSNIPDTDGISMTPPFNIFLNNYKGKNFRIINKIFEVLNITTNLWHPIYFIKTQNVNSLCVSTIGEE